MNKATERLKEIDRILLLLLLTDKNKDVVEDFIVNEANIFVLNKEKQGILLGLKEAEASISKELFELAKSEGRKEVFEKIEIIKICSSTIAFHSCRKNPDDCMFHIDLEDKDYLKLKQEI